MDSIEQVDLYLVRDLLAILTIFVFSLLGMWTVFRELRGSINILIEKIILKVKH